MGGEKLVEFLRGFLSKSSLKQRKPLKKEQVATLMHFCYCNARDLYDEAVLLRDNGKYARALTLCVLAFEELAKMPIALNAVFFREDDAAAWAGFWRTFNSHEYKQRAAAAYGKHGAMRAVDPERWGRFYSTQIPDGMPLHELKLASMYVDCYDGTAIRPNAVFTDNTGALPLVFEVVKNRLEAWKPLHSTPELSARFVEAASDTEVSYNGDDMLEFIAEDFRKRAPKKKNSDAP